MAPNLNQNDPTSIFSFTELAAGMLLPPDAGDSAKFKVVATYRVDKFEGEKLPDDGKTPFEVIEGGDDRPQTIFHPRE